MRNQAAVDRDSVHSNFGDSIALGLTLNRDAFGKTARMRVVLLVVH
jgi:hypothetical protein